MKHSALEWGMRFQDYQDEVPDAEGLQKRVEAMLAADASIEKIRGAVYRHLALYLPWAAGVEAHLAALRLSSKLIEGLIETLPVDGHNGERILAYVDRYSSPAGYARLLKDYPLDPATRARLKDKAAKFLPDHSISGGKNP